MKKLKHQQVGQAGEHFVAAELHRRGAYAVTFSGNMPNIDIYASDVEQNRMVKIQVKTKTAGTWHSNIGLGKRCKKNPKETLFWVLVDIGKDPDLECGYWVVPNWWMINHIAVFHKKALKRHGGKRRDTPDSKHFAITPKNVVEWRDQWHVLNIF